LFCDFSSFFGGDWKSPDIREVRYVAEKLTKGRDKSKADPKRKKNAETENTDTV
jgi:hypothetical protein